MKTTRWASLLAVVSGALLVCLLASGCGQIACGAARLHGYTGKCFPGQCVPERGEAHAVSEGELPG
jgi:hypothetical protein